MPSISGIRWSIRSNDTSSFRCFNCFSVSKASRGDVDFTIR